MRHKTYQSSDRTIWSYKMCFSPIWLWTSGQDRSELGMPKMRENGSEREEDKMWFLRWADAWQQGDPEVMSLVSSEWHRRSRLEVLEWFVKKRCWKKEVYLNEEERFLKMAVIGRQVYTRMEVNGCTLTYKNRKRCVTSVHRVERVKVRWKS